MNKTVDKFRNKIVPIGPPKSPIYIRLPWIGSPSQLIANKVSSSVTRCHNEAMVRVIFTIRDAFRSTHKYVLSIFQKRNLIHEFNCWCNATYTGRTSQRLEVRVKQYVHRDIRNYTTSRHWKLLDSAIFKHLDALNSCAVNYNGECFLIVLEVLYILFYKPTLCKQNPKHSLNSIGDNSCLTKGGFDNFPTQVLLPFSSSPPF